MVEDRVNKSKNTWNTIAESFDKTRKKPWPIVIEFIQKQTKKQTLLDLACGNGRHLIPAAEIYEKVIGIDISDKFLNIIKNKTTDKKNIELMQADIVEIPLEDNSVDIIIFIAALHNIEGNKNRLQVLKEIKRVLKKDGAAMISVWSKDQEKFKNDLNSDRNIDIYWKQDKLNIPRFYHLYDKDEFIEEIKQSGLKIIEIREEKLTNQDKPDNFFAVVTK